MSVCVPLLGLSPCVVKSPGLQFLMGKNWISVLGVTKGRAVAKNINALYVAKIRFKTTAL